MAYLETLFPQSYRCLSNEQRKLTAMVWQQELASYSFSEVQTAVRTAIREKKASGFAPGFDEILAQLRTTEVKALPGIDEWEAEVLAWLEERRRSGAYQLEDG